MFKGENKGLNKDEKTVRPGDSSIKVRFFGPRGVEVPIRGDQIELASGKGSQINTGISICGQVIW